MTPADEIAQLAMSAMQYYLMGDTEKTADAMGELCSSASDAFTAAMGFATVVASMIPGEGALTVEVVELATPTDERQGAVAALLAAAGNGDGHGAVHVFTQLTCDDQLRTACDLMVMAAVAARAAYEHNAGGQA